MGVKQGDQYFIPITLKCDGDALDMEIVDVVEFVLADINRKYPDEVSYDAEEGYFLFPVQQEETFKFRAGSVKFDARVKFKNGNVIGLPQILSVNVPSALSREVL